jgi:hypothetical protein
MIVDRADDLFDLYSGSSSGDYSFLWRLVLGGSRIIAVIVRDDGRQEAVTVRRIEEGGIVMISAGPVSFSGYYGKDPDGDFEKFNKDCEALGLRWLLPSPEILARMSP